MNDDFLARMRKPPRREFANKLYKRINKPMSEQHSRYNLFFFRRAALAMGILSLLLLLTLLVSPAARAFADEQFRQIGALIFRQADADPASSEATATPPLPTVPAPGDTNPPQNATLLEDASRLAGFTVLAPSYLPEGYQVDNVWSIDRQESGIYVVSSFRNAAKNQFLLLNQIQYGSGASFEQTYGDNEQLSDISVRDKKGVWITGRLMTDPTDRTVDLQTEPTLHATNWLVWQEGGITYALFGNGLSQTEMIRIAESLGD
jgi:hypothetical protein